MGWVNARYGVDSGYKHNGGITMGLGASQGRLMMLTARKSDLELQLQFINQARMQIANVMIALFPPNADTDPGRVQAQQSVMASVQAQDKMLEMHANRINTQHEAVQTEIEAVRKVISKNIESSFKLMG